MTIHSFIMLGKKAFFTIAILSLFLRCSDDQWLADSTKSTTNNLATDASGALNLNDCSGCTYVVPPDAKIIDGVVLGIKPGDVIGLDAKVSYGSLFFRNIVGTLAKPIVIKNCGGTANVNGGENQYGIKIENSAYFRITGENKESPYGIVVNGGRMSVNIGKLCTFFDVDHIEIKNSGFAGIMAKTDPGCDDATLRQNFVMKAVAIHNNYIHDTGGEGIYAGHTSFMGINTPCGVRLPHEIHYIRIYRNIVRNTGWDGIQLSSATKGASIHANTIENYGLANEKSQDSGIQISAGTGGVCYNNLIKGGTGNGMAIMGLADNVIFNNIIDSPGNFGIFCDERYTTGKGFTFLNNTILNPKSDGIRIYADEVEMNVIVNNLIINPGSYSRYTYPRKPEDAYVYKLNNNVKIRMSNNYFTMDPTPLQMNNVDAGNYRVAITSPTINMGEDISSYNINRDFYYKPRLRGPAYDIGAVEQY